MFAGIKQLQTLVDHKNTKIRGSIRRPVNLDQQ
jgi:hypothetical protein